MSCFTSYSIMYYIPHRSRPASTYPDLSLLCTHWVFSNVRSLCGSLLRWPKLWGMEDNLSGEGIIKSAPHPRNQVKAPNPAQIPKSHRTQGHLLSSVHRSLPRVVNTYGLCFQAWHSWGKSMTWPHVSLLSEHRNFFSYFIIQVMHAHTEMLLKKKRNCPSTHHPITTLTCK